MTAAFQQDEFHICLFELAGQSFGLRLESVDQIVPMATLSRPPSMPSILEGVLNLRGTAVPVLKMARLLGLPEDRLELHTPLVIMRAGKLPLALLVNRVTGIISSSVGDLMPLSESNSFNGCVDGRLTAVGMSVHLLSPDRLLLEKEQQILAEFQVTETRRLGQVDLGPS